MVRVGQPLEAELALGTAESEAVPKPLPLMLYVPDSEPVQVKDPLSEIE
jgi:hypothetical protein